MGIIFPTDHTSGIMPVSKTRLNNLTYTSCIYGISNEHSHRRRKISNIGRPRLRTLGSGGGGNSQQAHDVVRTSY